MRLDNYLSFVATVGRDGLISKHSYAGAGGD
jgi:hypothetical protein